MICAPTHLPQEDQYAEDNWLNSGLPKSTALAIHAMTQDDMNMIRITFPVSGCVV